MTKIRPTPGRKISVGYAKESLKRQKKEYLRFGCTMRSSKIIFLLERKKG